MPVYNQFYLLTNPATGATSFDPRGLSVDGPKIPVEIQIPNALAQSLGQQGMPVPTPVTGYALIDTGASVTAVDATIIQNLGVNPVGIAQVQTPFGTVQQNQYPVRLVFPGTPLPSIGTSQAIGSVLQSQGIIALIGRDVLTHFILICNGPGGFISLAY